MDIIHTCAQSYFASTIENFRFSRKRHTLLRTFPPSPVPRLRTRLRRINPAVEDLSSVAAHAAKEDSAALPRRRPRQAQPFPKWRPSARLTTGRYVKDQMSAVPRRTPQLYQIAAPCFKRGDAKSISPVCVLRSRAHKGIQILQDTIPYPHLEAFHKALNGKQCPLHPEWTCPRVRQAWQQDPVLRIQ